MAFPFDFLNYFHRATSTPQIVKMTPEALQKFKDMELLADFRKKAARTEGLGLDNLWGRSVENAQKLALIVACGDQHGEVLQICESHAEWAMLATIALVDDLADTIRENVGDNSNDRNRKKLLRVIRKAGKNGLRKAEITQKTQWSNRIERNSLLEELVEAEQLLLWDCPEFGKIYTHHDYVAGDVHE